MSAATTLPGESISTADLVAGLRKVNADQATRIEQLQAVEKENHRLRARLREVEEVGAGQLDMEHS
jgi:hypothetical protein